MGTHIRLVYTFKRWDVYEHAHFKLLSDGTGEWQLPAERHVCHDADSPNIASWCVTASRTRPIKHLWRHVRDRADTSPHSRKPKVETDAPIDNLNVVVS